MLERLTPEQLDMQQAETDATKAARMADHEAFACRFAWMQELLTARARLADLEAQAGAAMALLRRLEWRPCHPECTERFCPWCRAHEGEGHRPGCEVAAALAGSSEGSG